MGMRCAGSLSARGGGVTWAQRRVRRWPALRATVDVPPVCAARRAQMWSSAASATTEQRTCAAAAARSSAWTSAGSQSVSAARTTTISRVMWRSAAPASAWRAARRPFCSDVSPSQPRAAAWRSSATQRCGLLPSGATTRASELRITHRPSCATPPPPSSRYRRTNASHAPTAAASRDGSMSRAPRAPPVLPIARPKSSTSITLRCKPLFTATGSPVVVVVAVVVATWSSCFIPVVVVAAASIATHARISLSISQTASRRSCRKE